MESDFKLMLNQMINGGEYYLSDNLRIPRKDRKQHFDQMHNIPNNDKDKQRMHGGARQKTNIINCNVGIGNTPHVQSTCQTIVELCNIRDGLSFCDGLTYNNIICILNALCLQ